MAYDQSKEEKQALQDAISQVTENTEQKYSLYEKEIEDEEAMITEELKIAEETRNSTIEIANEEARLALEDLSNEEKFLIKEIPDLSKRNIRRSAISREKQAAENKRFRITTQAQQEYYKVFIKTSNQRRKLRQRKDELRQRKSKELKALIEGVKAKYKPQTQRMKTTQELQQNTNKSILAALRIQKEIEIRRAEFIRKEQQFHKINELRDQKLELKRKREEQLKIYSKSPRIQKNGLNANSSVLELNSSDDTLLASPIPRIQQTTSPMISTSSSITSGSTPRKESNNSSFITQENN